MPTARPTALATWAISRVVVLFPFVPVTATIGMRGRASPGSEPSAVACNARSSRVSSVRPSARRAAALPITCEIVRRRHG